MCKKCFSRGKCDSLMAEGELAGVQYQEKNAHRLVEVPVTFIELRESLLDSAHT